MSSILDLEVFVRTADTGSLSAAARGLGLTLGSRKHRAQTPGNPPGYSLAGPLDPQHAPDRRGAALPG